MIRLSDWNLNLTHDDSALNDFCCFSVSDDSYRPYTLL